MSYAVIPYILTSFTSIKKGKLSIYVSLQILTLLFQNMKNKEILQSLLLTLFGKKLNTKLSQWISHPAIEPAHFNHTWHYRHFWDDYESLLKTQTDLIFTDTISPPLPLPLPPSSSENTHLSKSGKTHTHTSSFCPKQNNIFLHKSLSYVISLRHSVEDLLLSRRSNLLRTRRTQQIPI